MNIVWSVHLNLGASSSSSHDNYSKMISWVFSQEMHLPAIETSETSWNKLKMKIIIELEGRNEFGKVDFSSCWDPSFRRSSHKIFTSQSWRQQKKTQEETSKNHFIIAFGERTDAGHTAHLQSTRLQNWLTRVTLVLFTSR